jgi:hypothetical protein
LIDAIATQAMNPTLKGFAIFPDQFTHGLSKGIFIFL